MLEVFGAVSSTRRSWQEFREVGGAHCFRTAAYDTKLNTFCIFVHVFMQYRSVVLIDYMCDICTHSCPIKPITISHLIKASLMALHNESEYTFKLLSAKVDPTDAYFFMVLQCQVSDRAAQCVPI